MNLFVYVSKCGRHSTSCDDPTLLGCEAVSMSAQVSMVPKNRCAFIFRIEQSKKMACDPSKRREVLAQRLSVISQKMRNCSNTDA